MNLLIKLTLLFIMTLSIAACESTPSGLADADNTDLTYWGRTEKRAGGGVALISSAASVTIHLSGKECTVFLKNEAPAGEYNYAVFELNGEYIGRFRVDGDSVKSFPVELPLLKNDHVLTIYKATEALTGNIIFTGISGQILKPLKAGNEKLIEFIGNSITCGMGADDDEIPCGKGTWYDQHNAYWSYGSIISRRLDTRCMLTSVSGIGLYRNWNTDHPNMTDVYQNTNLTSDSSKRWDFSSPAPDVLSICLGTNDLSDGDGVYYRKPFDEEEFISRFISFIQTLYGYYPKTKIALLSSPVMSGEKRKILENCLLKVQQHFMQSADPSIISTYFFDRAFSSGCGGHPDKNDQEQMADLLVPFFKELLKE